MLLYWARKQRGQAGILFFPKAFSSCLRSLSSEPPQANRESSSPGGRVPGLLRKEKGDLVIASGNEGRERD